MHDIRGCKPKHDADREERQKKDNLADLHGVRSFRPQATRIGCDVLCGKSVSRTVIGRATAFVERGNPGNSAWPHRSEPCEALPEELGVTLLWDLRQVDR